MTGQAARSRSPMTGGAIATERDALYEALRSVSLGEQITYEDLSGVAGRTVGSHTYSLRRALEAVRENDNMEFETIRSVGYKRLKDPEIVHRALRDRDLLSRSADRARNRLAAVQDFDSLDLKSQRLHNVVMAQLSATVTLNTPFITKTIEGRIVKGGTGLKIPLSETLRMFGM